MYRLQTEHSFDAAHFLADYEGKCHNIHGHHWRVVLEIQGSRLHTDRQQNGMLVDFSSVKHDLREAVDALDHTFILERGSLPPALCEALRGELFSLTEVDFRPTAENFAKYFYDKLSACGYPVYSCSVYETPVNCAQYFGEDECI